MDYSVVIVLFMFLTSSSWSGELQTIRSLESYDSCKPYEIKKDETTFSDQISDWANYYSTHEVPLELEAIYSYYDVKDGLEVLSLSDIQYCSLDKAALSRSLKNVPDDLTINSLNSFFGSNVNYEKLFSCLAIEESLGDPDTETSKKVYREVTGKMNKPAGVKFYFDRAQPKVSAINIGLFQFTPNLSGNINSCIKSWNKIFNDKKNCQIKSNADALVALSTSAQNFNAFCGIHKIIETSSIQMKSEKASAHFRPGESCVSLQMRAGLAYNHFGPFQNSTGKNLASLTRCLRSNKE